MNKLKIASILAAIGFLASAASKVFAGELPNWTEVTLAISTILAAIGFQRSAA